MKNELLLMFKYPSMIKTTAFCAATFGLLAVLLKTGIVIVPEVSEVRICNILSLGYGMFFGPAGALGVAIGNIIGDMSGSLTGHSPYGFLANFLTAYLPYKVWGIIGAYKGEAPTTRPTLHAPGLALRLILSFIISVLPCAMIISISTEIYASMPAANFILVIIVNNTPATLFGIAFFILMMCIPQRLLPYWRTMMEEERMMTFNKQHIKRLIIFVAITILLEAGIIGYLMINGYSLTVMDSFGTPIFAVCIIYALLSVAFGLSCTWIPYVEEDGPIELD